MIPAKYLTQFGYTANQYSRLAREIDVEQLAEHERTFVAQLVSLVVLSPKQERWACTLSMRFNPEIRIRSYADMTADLAA